ncbi:MAG: HEAT repeat domain-containing protein [Planctomycetota bacterium]|nr:HEAT repeat domain-containing protein [Planctomycetota bacterium]
MAQDDSGTDGITLEQLCSLLEAEDPALQQAAARVLGALQPNSGDVAAALGRSLQSADQELRKTALDAIRSIGSAGRDECYPFVVPLLDEEGDLGRRAMEVVASMGRGVLPSLRRRFLKAGMAGRQRILHIAARIQSPEAMDLILRALETGHAHEIRAAARRLAEEMATAPPRIRKALANRLVKFLASDPAREDVEGGAAAVELLERILGDSALPALIEYSGEEFAPSIRKACIEAIGRRSSDGRLDPELCNRLLDYLEDRDYRHVVAPAMQVLETATLGAAHVSRILAHLKGHDPALRRFAIAALGRTDSVQSAAALLEILQGDNPDLQERAAESLAGLKAALKPVAEVLVHAPDAARAWTLARILEGRTHKLPGPQINNLARAAAAWLADGDPRGEAVHQLLAELPGQVLDSFVLSQIKKLKRMGNSSGVANLLRPMVRAGGSLPRDLQYELALTEISLGAHDIVRETRLNHPGLTSLEVLARDYEFMLLARLKKEKSYLTPEDYFLVGCHFAERSFADRALGGELLRWVAATFPDERAAQAATHKLEMEGFPPPVVRKRRAPTKQPLMLQPPSKAPEKAASKPAARVVPKKKAPTPKKAPAKKPAPKTTAKEKKAVESATKKDRKRA